MNDNSMYMKENFGPISGSVCVYDLLMLTLPPYILPEFIPHNVWEGYLLGFWMLVLLSGMPESAYTVETG